MDTSLQSILDAFHDLLFLFSEEGVIKEYLSPGRQDRPVLSVNDFLGKHYRDVMPPHVSKKLDQAIEHLDRKETDFKFDYSIELDGEKSWFVAVVSKVDLGDKTAYLAAVRDITERKNKELLLQGVLNTAPSGIFVYRAIRNADDEIVDFEISQVNRSVEQLTGVSPEELVGLRVTTMIPNNSQAEILEQFKIVVNTGEMVDFEYHDKEGLGKPSWYKCKSAKFRDGVVSSFQDITELKEYQEKLVRKNQELKNLNRQKDKLHSVIAHDLTNAVSGSEAAWDFIFEEYDTLSEEELLEFLHALRENNRNANRLLKDLLMWSRNQFQEVEANSEIIPLAEVADQAFQGVKSKADDKEIALKNRVPGQTTVKADPNMLKTILRNLVGNGIKFTPEGGEVTVEAVQKDQEVKITVSDTGVGMDRETLEKALDKTNNFTSHGTSGEKGSGLGLDLCHDFLEKQGSKLMAESEPGKGTSFYFTLPAGTS
ncbi:MAG: ATP-binding protein [Balneolaceae bacterium]|nr:ATP-binding protein [Balneolaceae bacterium]